MTDPRFHWFLPTGGDSRTLTASSHGVAIGPGGSRPATGREPAGVRPPTLGYLTRLATAVEDLGFDGVLTPAGAHCEDAWISTAALIGATRKLRFLVAFRPGLITPVLAAQMAGTFQRLSEGRLMLNVVAGGSSAEQLAYGDPAGHDERYTRANEFLDVVRKVWRAHPFEHAGEWFEVVGGGSLPAPPSIPPVYLGGSSEPALEVAARHADVYLTWGEPLAAVASKIAVVKDRAAAHGRVIRAGLRIHVITRDTAAQAWADADRLIAGLDAELIAGRQRSLATLESEGQRRMLALHGGDRDALVIGPNLWAGIGLVRGGAGTALVGSHDEVAERISEYAAAGVEEFVLSGYPHLEEAYAVGEGVLPLLRRTAGPSLPTLTHA